MLFFSSTLYATSLVGYWNFDEGFLDQSPRSMFSTASNVGIVSGKFARAVYFNGTSSHFRISNNPMADDSNANFAVSFWVNPASGASLCTVFDNRGVGDEGLYAGFSVALKNEGNGFSLVSKVDDGQGNYLTSDGCGSIRTFSSWYFVAITVETNKMKVFVDGQLDSETLGNSLSSIENGLPIFIGANKLLNGNEPYLQTQFKGIIDDLSLYNGTLSNNDVLAIYNSSNESLFST